MPPLNTARLSTFARLIALGYPPVLAAKGAGYRNLRAGRAATRLGPQPAVAEAKPLRTAAAKETKTTVPAQNERPPLPPMLTEEEWVAKYGYLARREALRAQEVGGSRGTAEGLRHQPGV